MVRVNLLALAAWSAATAAARRCQNLTIPISITSENQQFNLVPPKSDIEVTNFILDLTRAQNNLVDELFTGVSPSTPTRHPLPTLLELSRGKKRLTTAQSA